MKTSTNIFAAIFVCFFLSITLVSESQAQTVEELERELEESNSTEKGLPDMTSDEYDFLNLGVSSNYMKLERFRTKDQILSFIPPLYQPAFVGHGYVLPPNTWRIAVGIQSVHVGSSDFFKGGEVDLVHENHIINRTRYDFDLFYGLDHDMTVRISVPFWSTQSTGAVHPAGVAPIDLYVEGSSLHIGDLSIFLKNKWFDQGNAFMNLATVVGFSIPTGSDSETFDDRLIMTNPGNPSGIVAFGGMPFGRFADAGSLPSTLQPGIGRIGGIIGLMGTKQFDRGAFHVGSLVRLNEIGADDTEIQYGNEVFYFASYVRPIGTDKVSLELAFNGKWKGDDIYPGKFTHPMTTASKGIGMPVMEMNEIGEMSVRMFTTPRPSFSGGLIGFVSPSVIYSPFSQYRLTLTGMIRVMAPDLGPAPSYMLRAGFTSTF